MTIGGYVERALNGFIVDPPDSPFQRGYLSALLAVHREGKAPGASGLTPRDLAELDALAKEPEPSS